MSSLQGQHEAVKQNKLMKFSLIGLSEKKKQQQQTKPSFYKFGNIQKKNDIFGEN